VTAICFGWFILNSAGAALSGFPVNRDFNDASLWWIVMTEAGCGGLALLYLQGRGHALVSLLDRPSVRGCIVGLLVFAAANVVALAVGSVFSATELAAQPIAQMVSQSRPSFFTLITLSVVNGFYEETFLAGYLIEQLRSYGFNLAIGCTTLVRLLCHMYQGPVGATCVTVYCLVFSIFYWRFRRLWPIVFAHALSDFVALSH